MATKRKYVVCGTVTVSAYTYVVASTPEEAVNLAKHRIPGLAPGSMESHGLDPNEDAIVEEADGDFCPESAAIWKEQR